MTSDTNLFNSASNLPMLASEITEQDSPNISQIELEDGSLEIEFLDDEDMDEDTIFNIDTEHYGS